MTKCKVIFDLPKCCNACPFCECVDVLSYGEVTGVANFNCTLLSYTGNYKDSLLEQEVDYGEFEWMNDRRHDKCPLIVIEQEELNVHRTEVHHTTVHKTKVKGL